jgi:transcriptional regulator with PAS, ATPase and Fis domain
MVALREAVIRIAAVASNVLLQGESGTGKELVARELHARSPRAKGQFVPMNCTALPPDLMEHELFGHVQGAFTGARRAQAGLFYYAQGGTLFLDEVAELPLRLQAMLLRAIDELNIHPVGSEQRVPVNVRLIAATNRNLEQAVASGQFRADLYYRLKVVDLSLPPLRDHREDLPDLVAHFLAQIGPSLGLPPIVISADEMAFLESYHWPGNCRELRNLLERSLILGGLNVSALYPGNRPSPAMATTDLQTLEKQHIQAVLASVGGDKSRAAQLLGVSRRTLERRVAEWGHA